MRILHSENVLLVQHYLSEILATFGYLLCRLSLVLKGLMHLLSKNLSVSLRLLFLVSLRLLGKLKPLCI